MIARDKPCGVLIVSETLSQRPIPGQLCLSAANSFLSNFGKGLSFELEGLGVDVLTYEPGPLSGTNKTFVESIRGSGTLIRPFIVDQRTAARVALGELDMEPYGSSCGTNIRHEMFEYIVTGFIPMSLFNYTMFNSGNKIRQNAPGGFS